MTTERKPSTGTQTAKEAAPAEQAAAKAEKEHVIVDIGKASRKAVRKLRKGKSGKLLNRVDEAVAHLRENGAIGSDAQVVVIVVRQRRRDIRNMWGIG